MASHSTVANPDTAKPNRLIATVVLSGIALLLMLVPGPWAIPLLLLAASLAWATALVPNESGQRSVTTSVVAWVPISFAAVLVVIALAGMTAWLLGIDIWSNSLRAALFWIGVLALPVALSWRRGGSIRFVGPDQPAAVVLATTMLVGTLLAALVPFQVLARNVSAGLDFGRHLSVLIKPVAEAGQLSYASSGYPRGLHALVGSPLPIFTDGSYQAAWIALEATAWLMIALSATALAVAAGRAAISVHLTSWFWRYTAAIATVVIFLQGASIDSFLRFGFVTSLLAVLVICAAVSTALYDPSSRSQAFQFGLLTVAMSQAWQLLVPLVVAPLVFLWIRALLTRHEVRLITLICVVTAALTLPAFLPLMRAYLPASTNEDDSGGPISGLAAAVANEGNAALDWPGWWWLVVIPLVVTTIVVLWRRGARSQVLLWLTMSLAAIVLVVGLWLLARDANTLPYYVLKSLWSALPILLPVAVVGAAIVIAAILGLPDRWPGPVARISRPVIIAVLVIGAITGIGGQWAGDRPTALQLANGLSGVAYQLPAISALEEEQVQIAADDTVLFWGFAPSSDLNYFVLREAGFADLLSSESLPWLGVPVTWPGGYSLPDRDTELICQYLRDNPETVRITGPNPESGLQWLLDSGCPTEIVRPAQWQVIEIDDSWFEGREELLPYSYPTWREAQDVLP
jgi:hypothetical protein